MTETIYVVGATIILGLVIIAIWYKNQRKSIPQREEIQVKEEPEIMAENPTEGETFVEPTIEEIRQRRLQRFAANTENVTPATSQPEKQKEVASQPTTTQPIEVQQKKKVEEKEERKTSSPLKSPLPHSPLQGSPLKSSIKPEASKDSPRKPVQPVTPEVIVHRTICRVFRVRTDSQVESDPSYYYLQDLATEIKERQVKEGKNGDQALLSESYIDALLIERASSMRGVEYLQYLVQSFNTVLGIQKKNPELKELVDHCIRSITSQAGLELQENPLDLFTLLENSDVNNFPEELLTNLCIQFEDDIPSIGNPVYEEISARFRKSTLMEPTLPLYKAVLLLTTSKPFTKVLTSSPNWLPASINARLLQLNSLLGPYFQFTSLVETPNVGNHYFPNPSSITIPAVQSAFTTIRLQLTTNQNILHRIVMNIFKGDETTREAMLNWFGAILNGNKKKLRLRYNPIEVSTDGFLLNLCSILLKVCAPFTSLSSQKMKTIDGLYCMQGRIDFSDETRLSKNAEEVSNWIKEHSANSNDHKNFVTESFFIAHYGLHVGLMRTVQYYYDLNQYLGKLQARRREMLANQPIWSQTPQAPILENQLKKIQADLDNAFKQKLCLDAHLLEPELLQATMNFYAFTGSWLVKLADPENKGLPLDDSASENFGFLPEFLVQNIADYQLFVLRFASENVDLFLMESLLQFSITFLGSTHFVKNPYIRAKLVEVLYEMFPQQEEGTTTSPSNRYSPIFQNNQVALVHLIPALINLYVDIETTGRGNQFYEKFGVRRQIAVLLKYLRDFSVYRDSLKRLSKEASDVFLRFINMMINDSHYLLDEVLTKLPEIREIELLIENKDQWMALDETVRKDKEEALATDSRLVTTFCLLSNETILLFNFLSEHVIEPFMAPQMVERIAQMLNYFLYHLAGPRSQNLKVKDPKRFHFNPRLLLSKIVAIYLHFHKEPAFIEAVVKDVRSFNIQVFHRAVGYIRRENLLPDEAVNTFEAFIIQAEKSSAAVNEEDYEMDDIPDDYLDPITCTLMEDPVILTTSGKTVDRATITRHLLTDQTDPFTRAKLTLEMLQTDTKLKEEIESWKNKKKRAKSKAEV